MEGCCKTLKPVVLELGGKDPFVICDDVALERVMPFIMKGSFFNAGQNCIGVERVFVYEKVGKARVTADRKLRNASEAYMYKTVSFALFLYRS